MSSDTACGLLLFSGSPRMIILGEPENNIMMISFIQFVYKNADLSTSSIFKSTSCKRLDIYFRETSIL